MGVKGPVKKLDIVPYRISGTEKLLILHLIPSAGSETETHVSQYPVGAHVFFYVLMLTKCYTYLGSLRSCTCIQNAYVRGLWRGFSYSDVHVQYMGKLCQEGAHSHQSIPRLGSRLWAEQSFLGVSLGPLLFR
ncbi:hypothetical protein FVEG_14820 [Fusarium verticillioides 7600]|uniref:Uncharacterized protein n=1 Tax=Gibberella moniliformis (strain M3125 / FGSC 7600) TaxID=334819 RepID=W7LR76_GIBM7|nr:hypothetical protein FVEG_14820 [Fusarium verticillioides 7600]EWG37975.1 hypothetical protein FVEG_14820 [Fusarium verticillioides 7600]